MRLWKVNLPISQQMRELCRNLSFVKRLEIQFLDWVVFTTRYLYKLVKDKWILVGNSWCYTTLKYLINKHARLTILKFSSTLLDLIRSCLLNCFTKNFHPACLLHPACLTIPESTCFSLIFSWLFWTVSNAIRLYNFSMSLNKLLL